MPLVVVHHQHRVKFALDGAIKYRIGGERPAGIDPQVNGRFNGGDYFLDFFPAEHPAFTAVGIQCRHADNRFTEAPLPEGGIGQLEPFENKILFHAVAGVLQ